MIFLQVYSVFAGRLIAGCIGSRIRPEDRWLFAHRMLSLRQQELVPPDSTLRRGQKSRGNPGRGNAATKINKYKLATSGQSRGQVHPALR